MQKISRHFECQVYPTLVKRSPFPRGMAGRLKGRVSYASLVGCGGYANKHRAATTSGQEECLIKMTLVRQVVYMMESGRNAQICIQHEHLHVAIWKL